MKTKILLAAVLCCGLFTASAQNFQQDIANIYADTIGSTNSTYIIAGERKLKGNANKVAALWLYNANDNVAAGAGIAKEWSPNGSAPSASYNLTVGIQLSAAIAPLNLFGITNKFARPFVADFVGTPFSGQNSGELMNASRAGVDVHIYKWNINKNPLLLSAGGYYGNETGTGYYAGNWAGGYLRVSWGAISQPTLSDNRKANAWSTVAFSQ